MTERKTFQKNIRFNKIYQDELKDVFDNRDKELFETEGDLVTHAVFLMRYAVSIEDPYYLEKMCTQRCLIKWGRHHICSRGGKAKDEKSRVKIPYVFQVDKKPLSLDGIIKICSECYYFGSSLLIDDKEIEEICFHHKLVKEDEGFVCLWGGAPCYKGKKKHPPKEIPRLFRIGKEALPLEIVRRICNSACRYTNSYKC